MLTGHLSISNHSDALIESLPFTPGRSSAALDASFLN
jgi:hypothetical protein